MENYIPFEVYFSDCTSSFITPKNSSFADKHVNSHAGYKIWDNSFIVFGFNIQGSQVLFVRKVDARVVWANVAELCNCITKVGLVLS